VDKVDSALEGKLDFAYDAKLGYLTACPTNVGNGNARLGDAAFARAGAERADQSGHSGSEQDRLAVRGLYGEGTEAMGNLFQISNSNHPW